MTRLPRALILGAIVSLFAAQQDAKDSRAGKADPPLEVHITVSKSELVSNEPVVAHVEIKNVSDKPVEIPFALEPDYNYLKFKIWGPGDRVHHYQPYIVLHSTQIGYYPLDPGEIMLHNQLIYYSADWGTHFREPGKYRIQASLYYESAGTSPPRVESNVLHLSVVPPTDDSINPSRVFRVERVAWFALGFSNNLGAGRSLHTFIERNVGKPFEPWCYYFLARGWERMRDMQLAEEIDRNALMLYQTLLERFPDFPLSIEVRYEIAKLKWRLGHDSQGRREIDGLIKFHPNLYLVHDIQRAIEGTEGEGLTLVPSDLPP